MKDNLEMEMKIMQMLDLLGEENTTLRIAIEKILNSKNSIGIYDTKQGFVCLEEEGEQEIPKISYTSQQVHAVSWLYTKALWEQSGSLDLKTVIRNLQCPTLIFYLASLTNLIEFSVEELVKDIHNEMEKQTKKITRRNIRFIETQVLINKLGDNWFQKITDRLTCDCDSNKTVKKSE